MLSKKKIIIYSLAFLVVFVSLLLVSTFYDYEITDLLAKKDLQGEIYYSHNIFGIIFEFIGEMPLYLFCVVAGSILIVKGISLKRIMMKILFLIAGIIAGVGMGFYGWFKLGFYFSEFFPNTCGFLYGDLITYCFMVIISAVVLFTTSSFIKDKIGDTIDIYLPYAFMILLTAALSNGINQLAMKPFWGRERYRAIRYFNNTTHAVADKGFTKWYVLNGSSSAIASSFHDQTVTPDFFKSFPSGHATACGIVYTIALLPLVFKKLDTKIGKLLCSLIPFIIMAVVCFSRILMGAHYLSDVLFGGTLAFVCTIASYFLYTKLISKVVQKMIS